MRCNVMQYKLYYRHFDKSNVLRHLSRVFVSSFSRFQIGYRGFERSRRVVRDRKLVIVFPVAEVLTYV